VKAMHCLLLLCLTVPAAGQNRATEEVDADRLRWFHEAKLGIFIHWGIYAVDGVSESWSFHNGHVAYDDYMAQLDGFTADRYDPRYWAELIRCSGARYAVLTAKHHDGVALWDSDATDLNVVERTPAGRDLIVPFADALRHEGIKVGLYYSLIDWSDPNYPNFTRTEKRYEEDPARWAAFSRSNHAQIRELSRRFDPDLVWFDGDWEQSAERWDAPAIRKMLLTENPQVIINSRLQGHGDYATPEQGVPIARPDDRYWELCMTMNDSWGYQPADRNYKSTNQIIRLLIECISMGGNMLLDIGPQADGTICDKQVAILQELGRWTSKHAEAIYGTEGGLPPGYFHGPSAVSADSSTVFLYLAHRPVGPVMLKGIMNPLKRVRVVGQEGELVWDIKMKLSWRDTPGVIYVDVPEEALDAEVTVLAVELDGALALYREPSSIH